MALVKKFRFNKTLFLFLCDGYKYTLFLQISLENQLLERNVPDVENFVVLVSKVTMNIVITFPWKIHWIAQEMESSQVLNLAHMQTFGKTIKKKIKKEGFVLNM